MGVRCCHEPLILCSTMFCLGCAELGLRGLEFGLEDLRLAVARALGVCALDRLRDQAGHNEAQALVDDGELGHGLALKAALGGDLLGPAFERHDGKVV